MWNMIKFILAQATPQDIALQVGKGAHGLGQQQRKLTRAIPFAALRRTYAAAAAAAVAQQLVGQVVVQRLRLVFLRYLDQKQLFHRLHPQQSAKRPSAVKRGCAVVIDEYAAVAPVGENGAAARANVRRRCDPA